MTHINRIIMLANDTGWSLREHQAKNTLLIFVKDTQQINVWYTKMTIGTLLNHPKQGRNMLYRRNVSLEELEKLFSNPREHVSKGYRLATPQTRVEPDTAYFEWEAKLLWFKKVLCLHINWDEKTYTIWEKKKTL